MLFVAYTWALNFPKVYDSLENWPKAVSDFCQLHKKASLDFTSEGLALESNSLTSIQKQFVAGIICLSAACGHGESAKYNKILVNIMVLASCLWWFGMVSGFPLSKSEFFHRIFVAHRAMKNCRWIKMP